MFTLQGTQAQWQVVFFISAAITAFGALFYVVLGSGEVQDWALEATDNEIQIETIAMSVNGSVSRSWKEPN